MSQKQLKKQYKKNLNFSLKTKLSKLLTLKERKDVIVSLCRNFESREKINQII